MTALLPPHIFVDTSGLYAAFDRSDVNHGPASNILESLLDALDAGRVEAVTHSAVITELAALVQNRLGLPALRALLDELVPLLRVEWVDHDLHALATTALFAANRRDVSLVDWTSFVVMRQQSIDTAFAFDDDFTNQGFRTLSAAS